MSSLKFITNILKPWEEFNELLSQPLAVQPDLSSFTHAVDTLAVSLSHWDEKDSVRRKRQSLINDIADTAKHIKLHKSERTTVTRVVSCFLCNDNNQFKFLRNIPFVKYQSNPSDENEYDFMAVALKEIQEILNEQSLSLERQISIIEARDALYEDAAKLKFDPRYCVRMDSTNVRFFKKADDNKLLPYAPPVRLVVLV